MSRCQYCDRGMICPEHMPFSNILKEERDKMTKKQGNYPPLPYKYNRLDPASSLGTIHRVVKEYFSLIAEVQAHLYMEEHFEVSPLTKGHLEAKIRELRHRERQLETRYVDSPTIDMKNPQPPMMEDV